MRAARHNGHMPSPNLPPATGLSAEPTGRENEYAVTVTTADGSTAVAVDAEGAAALIGLLAMRLSQSQTPEANRALQAFALRSIVARSTDAGIPYLEYKFESGLRFASGFSADDLRALHQSIGTVLGKVSKA